MQLKILIALFLFSHVTQAAEVGRYLLREVQIVNTDSSYVPGDMYYVLTPEGKRHAVLKIKQVNDDGAIAYVLVGNVNVGEKLIKRQSESLTVAKEGPREIKLEGAKLTKESTKVDQKISDDDMEFITLEEAIREDSAKNIKLKKQ